MSENPHKYKWTVMVYLAGDNNLTEECVYSLTEMKKLDTGDRIKVTAQFDPRGKKTPVHRYVINKAQRPGVAIAKPSDGDKGKGKYRLRPIADDVTAVVEGKVKYPFRSTSRPSGYPSGAQPEANTGDPKTLFDFISWSVEKYPADNYMVVLSGHAGGTEEDFLLKDENPRSSLTIPDLRRVFQAVKDELKIKVSILGMDVCLMSMGEIGFEVAGLADYIVSAEGYSATAGWPYGLILARLDDDLQKGAVSAESLGKIIVDEYTNYYSEYMVGGFSSNMSVLNVGVDAMNSFCKSVGNLTDKLNKELSKAAALKKATGKSEFLDQIVLAHWEAQSYNGERFADLYDFCELLGQRYGVKQLPATATAEEKSDRELLEGAIDAVKKSIKDDVVKDSCYSGVDYQYSYGLSIYFPWAEVGAHYKNLGFATESGWNKFLESYTEATRRNPRDFVPGTTEMWTNVEDFRTGEYRTGGYRTGGYRDPGLNPIYSMRNPPMTLAEGGQSSCLQEKVEMIKKLDFQFFQQEE